MTHTLRYNEPGNHVSFLIKMHLSPVSRHYHDGCLYVGFISAFNYDFFPKHTKNLCGKTCIYTILKKCMIFKPGNHKV